MSPRPAAPSRASVTAWRTASASEWPASPFGWSIRTPPRTSGRPPTSRCVSCPLPTRICTGDCAEGPGNLRGFYRRGGKWHNAEWKARGRPSPGFRSAADRVHGAVRLHERRRVESVPLPLRPDGAAEHVGQGVVVRHVAAEQRLDVRLVEREQAVPQLALG